MDVERGAAWRRRQRRLRSWWRHEQQTVAAVLATVTHHSHSKVGTANDAPRGQKKVTSTRVGPADDGRPTRGERPAALLEPWPQGKTERHDGIAYELVQALDAPVLQPNVVQFFATQVPVVAEPVIEVPKILPHDVSPRRLCRDTQLAEPLVEVLTILTPSFLRMLQNVDIPVPHGGRGVFGGLPGFLPVHVEQTVDIPAPRSGVRRLQGFLPEQSSTATSSSSLERISERNVEQIAVSRVGEGLQDYFLPDRVHPLLLTIQLVVLKLWMSLGTGFFAPFSNFLKSATQPPRSRSELPSHSSPWKPAAYDASMVLEEEEEEEESEDELVEYVLHDGRWWGYEWVPAHQRYCWWLAAADGSQVGHAIWRPPWLIGRGPG